MKNIIWLASYPKSGNTWFRVFLSNLIQEGDEPANINQLEKTPIASAREIFDNIVGFNAADLSFEEIDSLRPEVYQHYSKQEKTTCFSKIHDAYTFLKNGQPLIPPEATQGVIYFIRNPLDVAISFANHSSISIDKSIKQMANESFCFCNKPDRLYNQLRQQLLSWSGHVRSWTEAEGLELHIIRYEDMKENTFKTFSNAVKFAGLKKTPKQIKKALEFSDFSQLQKQEQENSFQEKSPKCKSFFNKGKSGYWKEILNDKQIDEIIKKHKDVMRKFRYLNDRDEPIGG